MTDAKEEQQLQHTPATYTLKEAARVLNVTYSHVRKLVAAGVLEGLRLGPMHARYNFVTGASVRRLLSSGTV